VFGWRENKETSDDKDRKLGLNIVAHLTLNYEGNNYEIFKLPVIFISTASVQNIVLSTSF
jgi:hypothetical protein